MNNLQQMVVALAAWLAGWLRPLPVPIPVRSRRGERGASLVEYALLVALIALVCIGAVTMLGAALAPKYSSMASGLS